jgi:hypothetical protein
MTSRREESEEARQATEWQAEKLAEKTPAKNA